MQDIRWRQAALLVLASACIALALAELAVRRYVPVRDVGPLFTVADPVMGRRIKRNLRTVRETPEFTMTFTTNSLGFRGPEPRAATVAPILFLGDSFTMGYGVNDGEEFPALVKAALDAQYGAEAPDVLNAGMGSNGNGRWVKFLKREADQFKPRLIVLQVMANDYDDNVREQLFEVSGDGTLSELPVRFSIVRAVEAWVDRVPGVSSSHLYGLLRQVVAARTRGMTPVVPADRVGAGGLPSQAVQHGYADRLTERLIEESLGLCQSKGFPVLALLVGLEGARLDRLRALFRDQQVPVVLVASKAERPDLYFRVDGHWNRDGHAHVAQVLFENLVAMGFSRLKVPQAPRDQRANEIGRGH